MWIFDRKPHRRAGDLGRLSLLAALAVSLLVPTGTQLDAQTCTPPPAGLVAWWPLDSDGEDVIGSHQGTAQGAGGLFVPSLVGNGFRSGGQASVIVVPDASTLDLSQFTLDAWIRIDALYSLAMDLVFKGNSAGQDLSSPFAMWVNGSGSAQPGLLGFLVTNGSAEDLIMSAAPLPLGQFLQVAATYDGSVARLYVNGSQVNSKTMGLVPVNSIHPIQIGGVSEAAVPNYLNGVIDEVEYFNRALGSSEIQTIYNAGAAGKCRACGIRQF